WDLHPRPAAVDGRHLNLSAESSRGHGNRHAAEQVRAVALEELMRLDRKEDVEIARRTAAHPRLAFASAPDARAILDAHGNGDGERALARDAAGAVAGWARRIDGLAASLAGRASALDGEEALAGAHFADAAAGAAGGGRGAGLGPRARATLARYGGRHSDLR